MVEYPNGLPEIVKLLFSNISCATSRCIFANTEMVNMDRMIAFSHSFNSMFIERKCAKAGPGVYVGTLSLLQNFIKT